MKPPVKKYWHPVAEAHLFAKGYIIWIDQGPYYGYNEVLAVGRKELLVRHLPRWEVWLRHLRGRWRRFWIRRRRLK